MPWDWVVWAMIMGSGWSPQVDESARKYQVVTPKADGIAVTAINDRGEVVGFEWVEDKDHPGVLVQAPFLARGKEMAYLPLLKGYTATFPADVSDDGRVVGRASKPAPLGMSVPLRNQAFLWDAEAGIRGLGVLEGDVASFASGISRDGGRISGCSVGPDRVRACVWERDGEVWKGTALPHDFALGSNVIPISDDGRFVAAVDGTIPCLWSRQDWGAWKREILGEPGAIIPRAVNNSGMVVGLRFDGEGRQHAVIWSREQGMTLLAEPAGYVRSEASAVNNAGVVVGFVDGPNGSEVGPNAFVCERGRLRLLDEGGPHFTMATAINDHGQIAGVVATEEEADPAPLP
jgi:uncharacterized membrane protein